jgi:hypothetical protein
MGVEVDVDRDDKAVAEVGFADFFPVGDVALFVDSFEVSSWEGPVEAAAGGKGEGQKEKG